MSEKPKDRRTQDAQTRHEDKIRVNLSNIIDNINTNNLSYFYPKDESLFKRRVDKLNYKFYIETEKYLTNKNDMERCQDQLFMILFKQISLYIEEVERLNYLLKEKIEDEQSFKDKMEDFNRKEREKSIAQISISNLKNTNKTLERRLEEKVKIENKLKNENESMQRQLKFYKEQLESNITSRKVNDAQTKKKRNMDELINNINSINSLNSMSNLNSSVISKDENNFRSNSKDSTTKKVSISINTNINTMTGNVLFNSIDKERERDSFYLNSNTNSTSQEKNVKLNSTFGKNPTVFLNPVQFLKDQNLNLLCNSQENLSVSKILNKKRNYSDNNPSNVKKNPQIVSVTINNRYGNINNNNTNFSFNELNNYDDKIKREFTKSMVNTTSTINSNFNNNNFINGSNASNTSNTNKYGYSHTNPNVNYNSNGRVNIKSPDNKKTLNINVNETKISNLNKPNSKSYKDFKIIKSIKLQGTKTESQEDTQYLIDDKLKIKSPKSGSKIFNINFDPFPIQQINTSLSSTRSNDNLIQDYFMSTIDQADDELNYLNELEKILNNTKNMLPSLNSKPNSSKTNTNLIYKNYNSSLNSINNSHDHELDVMVLEPPLQEIGKRSESLENTNNIVSALLLSDEEYDGYKSDKQMNLYSHTSSNWSNSNSHINQSRQIINNSNNINKSSKYTIKAPAIVNNINTVKTKSSYISNNNNSDPKKLKAGLASVTIDLVKKEKTNNLKITSKSKKKIDMVAYLNKIKNK